MPATGRTCALCTFLLLLAAGAACAGRPGRDLLQVETIEGARPPMAAIIERAALRWMLLGTAADLPPRGPPTPHSPHMQALPCCGSRTGSTERPPRESVLFAGCSVAGGAGAAALPPRGTFSGAVVPRPLKPHPYGALRPLCAPCALPLSAPLCAPSRWLHTNPCLPKP